MKPAEMGGFETAIARGDHSTGEIQGQTRLQLLITITIQVNKSKQE